MAGDSGTGPAERQRDATRVRNGSEVVRVLVTLRDQYDPRTGETAEQWVADLRWRRADQSRSEYRSTQIADDSFAGVMEQVSKVAAGPAGDAIVTDVRGEPTVRTS